MRVISYSRGLLIAHSILAHICQCSRFTDSFISTGGIVHVSALGQSIIILNDPKYAVEMLDKKGLLYSDRPKLVMGGQMVGWEEAPVLSPFCDRWAEYRRLMSQFMGTKAKIDELNHVLQEETNVLLKQCIADPHDWVEHLRRFAPTPLHAITCLMCHESFAGGLVLQLVYGYRASDPGGKELVKLVDDAMHGFSVSTKANAFLVDVFPICWYPYPSFASAADSLVKYNMFLLGSPAHHGSAKRRSSVGILKACYTYRLNS